jgi:hypothetical protein
MRFSGCGIKADKCLGVGHLSRQTLKVKRSTKSTKVDLLVYSFCRPKWPKKFLSTLMAKTRVHVKIFDLNISTRCFNLVCFIMLFNRYPTLKDCILGLEFRAYSLFCCCCCSLWWSQSSILLGNGISEKELIWLNSAGVLDSTIAWRFRTYQFTIKFTQFRTIVGFVT